jgi:hypothetical protein
MSSVDIIAFLIIGVGIGTWIDAEKWVGWFSSYLKWLAENCDWDDKICEEADEEWQYREKYNTHRED